MFKNLNRISTKLLVVCLTFSLPIAVMLKLMVDAKQKDIEFAKWEIKGNAYQRPLEAIMEKASIHRHLMTQKLLGDSSLNGKVIETEAQLTKSLQDLKAINSKLAVDLQFTKEGLAKRNRQEFTFEGLESKWSGLMDQSKNEKLTLAASEESHRGFIAHIRTMITHMGDTSNLILDPDLDSYYLMDVTLLALPQTQDRLQEIMNFVEQKHSQRELSKDDRIKLAVFASFLQEADLDRIVGSTNTALNEDPNFYGVSASFQKRAPTELKAVTESLSPVIASLKEYSSKDDYKSFDLKLFRQKVDLALSTLYKFHAIALDEEDTFLEARVKTFYGAVKDAIVWTSLALIISAILAFFIAANIIRRVNFFNSVTKIIAGGNLKARVKMESGDEIGQLARSFDGMTEKIDILTTEIEAKNQELKSINSNLEVIIEERTATIKTILDNVKFGFLLINRNLNIIEGYSKSCLDLLGTTLKPGQNFLSAVGISATRIGPLAAEFLSQAFDDFLPEEMTLHQLPNRVQLGDKILTLIATPVRNSKNEVVSILFTIIDSTHLEKMERENQRHKVLVRLLKEFDAFKDFLEEIKSRIALCRRFLNHNEQGKIRAELHTMKGNSSAYDLIDIAKLIHFIEDSDRVNSDDLNRIEASFVDFLETNYDVLQLSWEQKVEENFNVSKADVEKLLTDLKRTNGADERFLTQINQWLQNMQFKSAASLFGALPEYAERLAGRMGKNVKIDVQGGDQKMDPEVMRPVMQSLIHVVRNAIDHGIELPHLRQNKPETASIKIHFEEDPNHWNIIVQDDGRGIDADRLVEKAMAAGLLSKEKAASMSLREKYGLVFLSGVSTAEAVTDISGRGVGMAALEAAVKDVGGIVEVESQTNHGTTVKISVPNRSSMKKSGDHFQISNAA